MNPFDTYSARSLPQKRNNPFLTPSKQSSSSGTSLHLRASRLQQDMKAYERRMKAVWEPTNRLEEITKKQAELEWMRGRIRADEGDVHYSTDRSEVQLDLLKEACERRLSDMRVSLDQQLSSRRSERPERPRKEAGISPLLGTSGASSRARTPRVSILGQSDDLQWSGRDSEVMSLREEQTRLKSEIEVLKQRLSVLERQSAIPFAEAMHEPSARRVNISSLRALWSSPSESESQANC